MMAYWEGHNCQCRNCKEWQIIHSFNGELPAFDRAIATCDHCGFKSIWFLPEIKLDEKTLKKITDIVNGGDE